MKGRGGIAAFFVFLFLSIIIVLQILSMVQSDRLYECFNHLDDLFEGSVSIRGDEAEPETSVVIGEEYPGDEGDWLVWAFIVEPKTLNQINVDSDIYSRWITIPNIFEPLLAYDYDTVELKPWLAKNYEVSNEGLEITFLLRDDIKFSDGEPITAEDVVFTYETIINPLVDGSNVAQQFIDIDRVAAIDERTVKFYMKRPYFKSLQISAFTWDVGIYPKHIYKFEDAEQFNKRISNPVGSGPYMFEKWDVGSQIVLRRNENYWGPKPKLEKIVYKFITNASASLQALRSGQVDVMIPASEQFADIVEDAEFNKEFRCLSYWTPWTPFFYMGWGGGILEDPYQIFHSSQIGNRACNYVGFSNAHADVLMEQARATLDSKERIKLFHQLHEILHEEQPYTFLFTRPTFRLIDRRFENVKIHNLGLKYLEWYVPSGKQKYK